jgi:hypothetical protein
MNIDQELRDALRRKEAARDLAERVLQRINTTPAPAPHAESTWTSRGQAGAQGVRRWLAAAAVFALAVGGAERYYTHQQQAAEAARVREELRIALEITNDTLARVQSKISDIGNDQ